MPPAYADPLVLTRRVLRALIALNLLLGFLILALLIASLVDEELVMSALGARPSNWTLNLGMRLIMVLGIVSVPLAHLVLTHLMAIVQTVGLADPFVAENAVRLQKIAWGVLGLEVMHLTVGVMAAGASTEAEPLDVDWSFSLARWLTVLLLFVLARVFEHGARMREDLAGTI